MSIASLKHKELTSTSNSTYSNQACHQVSTYTGSFKFLDQTCPKLYFSFKSEKSNVTTESKIFKLIYESNFI